MTLSKVIITWEYLSLHKVHYFEIRLGHRGWVMGDNRSNSADSRYHMGSGQSPYVPVSSVVGTVQAVIWPTSRWTTDIAHHEVFASVPDAS